MRILKLLSALTCLSILLTGVYNAEPPTSQPTTAPSANALPANSPIRRWFLRLSDPDPKIRDQAKTDLMGISADDLPKLRQLVIDSRPVSPAQSAALHDIVLQAYLASEPYKVADGDTDAAGTTGPFFMGLFWPVPDNDQARLGVAVDVRLPGFPGYRFLRKGDMIMGVYFNPDLPLEVVPNMLTNTQATLSGAIKSSPGTQNIVLQVLRDGETMRIPIKMAPRPAFADPINAGSMTAFVGPRVEQAEAYWNENFASLLDGRIDTSNLAQAP